MPKLGERIGIFCNREMLDGLDKFCKERSVSRSIVVRMAIREFLTSRAKNTISIQKFPVIPNIVCGDFEDVSEGRICYGGE